MRPHDLLRLKSASVLAAGDAPDWVAAALIRAPWVVVRRDHTDGGAIPVGFRGHARAQRFATTVREDDVAEVVTPEALALAHGWRSGIRDGLPALRALESVAAGAALARLAWGPVGSVGFELASGTPVVSAQSDLDVILRPTARDLDAGALAAFQETLRRLDVRVDVTLETAQGAVALEEWLESPTRVLIKTPLGPRIGAFSW